MNRSVQQTSGGPPLHLGESSLQNMFFVTMPLSSASFDSQVVKDRKLLSLICILLVQKNFFGSSWSMRGYDT